MSNTLNTIKNFLTESLNNIENFDINHLVLLEGKLSKNINNQFHTK